MKEIGPRERMLREQREAKFMRSQKPNPFEDAASGRDPAPKSSGGGVAKRPKQPSMESRLMPPGSPDANSGAPQPRGEPVRTKSAQPTGSPNIKRGRPKKGEKRDKPWDAEGISKASYYRRRQKEKK